MLGQHFDTEDFTVAIHDGPLAGQEIPHVHIHVIPRQQGDGGGSLPLIAAKQRTVHLSTFSIP